MISPYDIKIECDGAMNYDSKQTGGIGFIIYFPDCFEHEPITEFDGISEQGIHRTEMIGIYESIERLIVFGKINKDCFRVCSGVVIYTDRYSLSDSELLNPYKIRDWRKNKWKNYSGKEIKNSDLLEKIDKSRKKLSKEISGRVEIKWKKRSKNKTADKLSKEGKNKIIKSKRVITKKNVTVCSRKFDGKEVDYSSFKPGDRISLRIYSKELVGDSYELLAEIFDGNFIGSKIKLHLDNETKRKIHLSHSYILDVVKVSNFYVEIDLVEELFTNKEYLNE